MNRVLLELIRGNFYIAQSALDGFTPLVLKILSGETVEMQLSPIRFSSFSLKTQNVVAHRYDKPLEVISSIEEDTILTINVDSTITKYDNCGFYGAQSYAGLITAAANHDAIKGIVLIADSPGGSADGSFDFSHAVKQAKTKKPVVTYVDGMAASAMYRIAAHSSHIIAKPGSMIGSIGTMSRVMNYKKYMERIGITEETIYADGSPDKNKPVEDLLNKGDETLFKTEYLNPLNDLFLQEMKLERNLPKHVLTGKIYYPEAALQEGLIDSIGVLEDAIRICTELAQTHISKSYNPNDMSLKIPAAIAAFFGMSAQAESISQEQLDKLNQHLEGFNQKLSDKENENQTLKQSITEKNTSIQTLTAENQTLKQSVSEKDASIQTLTTEKAELQTKVEAYGAQPGATPSNPGRPTDQSTDLSGLEEEAQQILKKFL